MKIRDKAFCFSFLVCGMLSFSGCSNAIEQNEETPYYSVTIDGEKDYRAEEDEDVKQLIKSASKFTELICSIDYKNQEHAFDVLDYYSKNYRSICEEHGYIESSIESAKYYEQISELVDYSINGIQFLEFHDQKTARVACVYISRITHATEQYLEDVGVKMNTKYSRTMDIEFIKEDGEWKIEGDDLGARVEVE